MIRISLVIWALFIAFLLADKFHFFFSFWWFDIPMHFIGGFASGLVSLFILKVFRIKETKQIPFLIAGILLIGVLWELFEVGVDTIIFKMPTTAPSVIDSLSDLCFDIAGGIVAVWMYFKRVVTEVY